RKANEEAVEGIVITHGTDSAAYLSSALRHLLKNQAIPVTITGAQVPARNEDGSANYDSDAFQNTQDAVFVAGFSDIAEPTITFSGEVFSSENVRKERAWHKAAYKNLSAVTSIAGVKGSNLFLDLKRSDYQKRPEYNYRNTKVDAAGLDRKIARITVEPGLKQEFLSSCLERVDGAVLATLGGGNVTTKVKLTEGGKVEYDPESLIPPIIDAARQGKPVIVCTSAEGPTDISTGYELGHQLLLAGFSNREHGLVANVMTGGHFIPEFAYVRLHYLLAHWKELQKIALEEGVEAENLRHALFVSGTKFRHYLSLKAYEQKTGIKVPREDLLFGNCIESAARKCALLQKPAAHRKEALEVPALG
ncbi:MAG TPA: asparaginase domain-containing protein, partial [archaeon]|nr:asparaginase domain-containing protein [archaeon]